MPKKSRPSIQKRERENRRNERRVRKAERAAARRDATTDDPSPEAAGQPESTAPPEAR